MGGASTRFARFARSPARVSATVPVPNHAEKVSDGGAFDEFSGEAKRRGLPRVVLLTSKPQTTSLYKSLSLRYKVCAVPAVSRV